MYKNEKRYALVNGVLLDGTRDMAPQAGKVICVDGSRIAAVTDGAAPAGYETVDLGGQYVLPGLINLHVHLPASGKPKKKPSDPKKLVKLITSNGLMRRVGIRLCEGYAKMELLSGVTTIRTVGGVADFDTIIRDQAAAGAILSPRVVASNMAVSVPGGHMAGSLAYEARTPEEAAACVEKIAAEKPDLIKLMITGGVMDAEVVGGTMDVAGRTVTPGFIDIHRHADAAAFRPDYGSLELRQGLTTIVNGNCGLSAAPFGPDHAAAIRAYLRPITGDIPDTLPSASLAAYLAALRDLPLHTGMLVGAGILRADTAGYELEHLDEAHYRAIHRAMERALGDGALGVSLGLGYAPECFCTTEELIHTLEPLRGQDIPLTVHMRQEGAGVCTSVEEMLTVARTLRIPLHISHLKAMGRDSWGKKIPRALALLEQARQEGLDVSCDVYPYTAGSTQLLHILPPEFLEGGMDAVVRRLSDPAARRELARRIESGSGFDDIARLAGWDGIYLTSLHCPEDHPFLGKSLAQIAALTGQDPLDCCCDLLVREDGQITMIDFMASEEDIIAILQSDLSNLISDATYPTEGMPHPRVYGTFPRLIQHFVMKKHALTLEQAVRKMTALPARALRLRHKGVIAEGMDADLCVFDPAQLRENGDYRCPCRMASGLDAVLVAGQPAVIHDTLTGAHAGTVIRRELI